MKGHIHAGARFDHGPYFIQELSRFSFHLFIGHSRGQEAVHLLAKTTEKLLSLLCGYRLVEEIAEVALKTANRIHRHTMQFANLFALFIDHTEGDRHGYAESRADSGDGHE